MLYILQQMTKLCHIALVFYELNDIFHKVQVRGRSHITSALFGVSGHPWWCCKQWSAFALTLGTYTLMT